MNEQCSVNCSHIAIWEDFWTLYTMCCLYSAYLLVLWKYVLCVFKLLSPFLAHLGAVQPNLGMGNSLFPPQLYSLHSGLSAQWILLSD